MDATANEHGGLDRSDRPDLPGRPDRDPVFEIDRVSKHYGSRLARGSRVNALSDVSLELGRGEVLGIVGQSGSGKSTLGRLMLGLERPDAGRIRFAGEPLDFSGAAGRRRRRLVQAVFQDPFESLNPYLSVEETLLEPLVIHGVGDRAGRARRVRELIDQVGIPESALRRRADEFSGGQQQRIAIARAIALEPAVLIADEPTASLDVSIQAQILNLLSRLKRESGMALVLISHNLGAVKHLSDRIAVLYRGELVEQGDAIRLTEAPEHPYTRSLLDAIPVPDPQRERERRARRLAEAAG